MAGILMPDYQSGRSRVLEHRGDLVSRQRGIQRDRVDPGLLHRHLPPHHVGVIGQYVGDDRAGPDPAGAQRVHKLMGLPASSPKVSVTPEGDSTMAGSSGWSVAIHHTPRRWSHG